MKKVSLTLFVAIVMAVSVTANFVGKSTKMQTGNVYAIGSIWSSGTESKVFATIAVGAEVLAASGILCPPQAVAAAFVGG